MKLINDSYPYPFYIGATCEGNPGLINSFYTITTVDSIIDDAAGMVLFFYNIRNNIKRLI